MDNVNRTDLTPWIAARTIAPADWEPNADAARARFHARLSRPSPQRRYWLAATVAASVACTILLLTPTTRALAQQLWRWITVGEIAVVRVDFDSLPDDARSLALQPIQRPGPPALVSSVEAAAQRTGFVPRLPAPHVLSSAPRLSVLGPMAFGTVLKRADLELALQKAGITDEAVPEQWDNARITVQIGSSVTAEWNDITLMQATPAVLSTPAGFDLGRFATALLRAVGMDRNSAQRFGQKLAASPALLLGIAAEDQVRIQELTLNSGPATLIEDFTEDGRSERVAILWSTSDRVYILSGAITAEFATAIANSIR